MAAGDNVRRRGLPGGDTPGDTPCTHTPSLLPRCLEVSNFALKGTVTFIRVFFFTLSLRQCSPLTMRCTFGSCFCSAIPWLSASDEVCHQCLLWMLEPLWHHGFHGYTKILYSSALLEYSPGFIQLKVSLGVFWGSGL
ncbi:mCG4398 [Mus musculus]|nr:mCG4398 [Mus musculus]